MMSANVGGGGGSIGGRCDGRSAASGSDQALGRRRIAGAAPLSAGRSECAFRHVGYERYVQGSRGGFGSSNSELWVFWAANGES